MNFIDRTAELARLDRLQPPCLAVLWGRRRVGKTRLLLQWCHRRGGLYTVADQSAEPIQRRYLAEAIGNRLPGFADVVYPDWRALFSALARQGGRGALGGPLILDEVPYLMAASPSLASVLQAFVDHEGRDAGILLLLAGSSQRMMHGLVLDGSAPLYGRAREAFELLPLPAGYLGEALALPDPRAALRAHAVWGGIPWYWELAEPFGADLDGAVDALVLDPAGPLHREPDRLLAEEQPTATALRPLLDAIGAGAHRLSEIAARIGQPATSLSRPLGRLVELGFVRREQPFGDSERTAKRSLYRIADPFLRLWFSVVAPRRALLVASPRAVRQELWRQTCTALFAEAWEELCRQAVPRLAESLPCAFGPAARSWSGAGPEWDVVARSLDRATLLLGECKWVEGPVSEELLDRTYQELLRKGRPGGGGGPGTPGARGAEATDPVYVLFVPGAPPGGISGKPYRVIGGAEVLAASR